MIKKIWLIFLSLTFSLLLIYCLVFTWVKIFENYKSRNFFKDLESLNYHEKYSNKVHHLRGNLPNSYLHKDINKEDYLFTIFSQFSDEKKNYLIQGDSWAEYLTFNPLAIESLQKVIKKKNIGLLNGGISSFSPSPMKVQYEILEKEYNYKPDYLISIIDHSVRQQNNRYQQSE